MKVSQFPLARIVIVGGGTAGWMAANLLAHHWQQYGVQITLIESTEIGIIGVGEGSTPYMKNFFQTLGISESIWMPACNATYKCGIRFPDWSTVPGYTQYTHPFFSIHDRDMGEACFRNANMHRRGIDAPANPQDFFMAAELARTQRAPIAQTPEITTGDYAYHFDAGLLGQFLKQHALGLNVVHRIATIAQVQQQDNGDIKQLLLTDGEIVTADFFIDCSGFAGLLINQALGEPFISYGNNLFNDRAVALPTLGGSNNISSETVSTALGFGWAWQIPLLNRFGNGYVYSSYFLDKEAAEKELRAHLGSTAEGQEARHLSMRVGRIEQHWRNNCLAVGLSQGFIEPLEATALMLTQFTIMHFIAQFEAGQFTAKLQATYNQRINQLFEGVRDYVVAHYYLNTREDTDYWRICRTRLPISDRLASFIEAWDKGLDFEAALHQHKTALAYFRPSWYCLFAGMGRFPQSLRPPSKDERIVSASAARAHCAAMALHYPKHREYLDFMSAGCEDKKAAKLCAS